MGGLEHPDTGDVRNVPAGRCIVPAMRTNRVSGLILAAVLSIGCGSAPPVEGLKAFVGATLVDGESTPDAVIVVRDGRVEASGSAASVAIPAGAERVELSGKFVTPGLIVGHGHVGASLGLESGPDVYTRENLIDQLGLYALYGITTVVSLGGDGPEAIRLRDEQLAPGLQRARIFAAGSVVVGDTPDAALAMVNQNADMNVDFIKIRVDDNLGSSKKMSREVYQAVIKQSHERGLPLAAHLYYYDDAKSLLEDGVDFIAHSIRDRDVDAELAQAIKDAAVCLCPTLTREVSTFVYEDVPEFFEDPFFLKYADPQVLEQLKAPERQARIRASKSAQQYKVGLDTALRNLKALADAGVKIVFGTDTGQPGRFQGYFEHMELELMAKAGLSPEQILRSATSDAAECLGLNEIGSLEAGKWADFVVLDENPLEDIRNMRTIDSVWMAGEKIPAN